MKRFRHFHHRRRRLFSPPPLSVGAAAADAAARLLLQRLPHRGLGRGGGGEGGLNGGRERAVLSWLGDAASSPIWFRRSTRTNVPHLKEKTRFSNVISTS